MLYVCLLDREASGQIKVCVIGNRISYFSFDFVLFNKICAFLLFAGCG